MLDELLGNAFKYAPGATVTAGVRLERNLVVVEVSDDGPGLSVTSAPMLPPGFGGRRGTPRFREPGWA